MATAFQAAAASDSVPRAPLKARVSWMLFDWATQPYYTLVQTFLFAPYFANAVVENAACGDMIAAGSEKAACGQALWGYAAAVAGLLIALLSPVLGAAADGRGSRKPWMAALSLVFLAGLSRCGRRRPAANFSVIGLVLLGFVAATLAAELMAVMSNAIMVGLVPQHELGRLSGTAGPSAISAALQASSSSSACLAPLPGEATTLFGLDPILKLDAGAREGDRITGPFAAVWFALFVIPFFLFVPDRRAPPPRPAGARPGPNCGTRSANCRRGRACSRFSSRA